MYPSYYATNVQNNCIFPQRYHWHCKNFSSEFSHAYLSHKQFFQSLALDLSFKTIMFTHLSSNLSLRTTSAISLIKSSNFLASVLELLCIMLKCTHYYFLKHLFPFYTPSFLYVQSVFTFFSVARRTKFCQYSSVILVQVKSTGISTS